jgi:hypothetical protein
MYKIYIVLFSFLSNVAIASGIKETPNKTKDTDMNCIFTSYRIKKPNDSVDHVQIKVCSKRSMKVEPSKRSSLSERKAK